MYFICLYPHYYYHDSTIILNLSCASLLCSKNLMLGNFPNSKRESRIYCRCTGILHRRSLCATLYFTLSQSQLMKSVVVELPSSTANLDFSRLEMENLCHHDNVLLHPGRVISNSYNKLQIIYKIS